MVSEYEEPPVLGEVTPEERAILAQQEKEARAAEKALKRTKPLPTKVADEGYRTFIAPIEKNTRFLAKAGEVVWFRDQTAPLGRRDISREGDVTVQFTNGILTTKDPDIIEWCEANPDICRDAADPRTKVWADLKERQIATASREPLLERSLDVDELVYGDPARAQL